MAYSYTREVEDWQDGPVSLNDVRHNAITRQAAQKLIDRLASADEPLAVFTAHGSWTVTRPSTQSFADKCRLRPNTLMGVYDANSLLQDIEQDFALMGIK